MADTIITPRSEDAGMGAAGWAVAVIVLLAVIFGGLYLVRNTSLPASTVPAGTDAGADINVTLPGTDTGAGNNTGNTGGTGGATQQ